MNVCMYSERKERKEKCRDCKTACTDDLDTSNVSMMLIRSNAV